MTDHPDLDALSASLDEDRPEGFDAHLQSCVTCRQRRAELVRARDAVAEPVAPLAAELRDRAIAQALAGGAAPPQAKPSSSRLQWWLGGAAAAVAAVVLGAVVLLSPGRESSDQTALSAGPATEREAATDAAANAAANAASGTTDLGDVPSIEALRSRIPMPLASVAAGTAESRSSSGAGSAAAAPVPPAAPSAVAGQSGAVQAQAQAGTRVCEEAARTARPQLGVVVYAANLRYQGTPAVVLGFAPTATGPPATLLVLAPAQGCRLLAESPS